MATDNEKRARKAKATKNANKAKAEHDNEELRKARSSARNARIALQEYKKGMDAGIKLVVEAMRANS